jgi:hypothetical protein
MSFWHPTRIHDRLHALDSALDHTGRITLTQMARGASGYFLKGQGLDADPVYASVPVPTIQAGVATTDANGDKTVTFPTPFPSTPYVVLQGLDASAKGIVLDIVSRSASQVVVKARKTTGITSGAGGAHQHVVLKHYADVGDSTIDQRMIGGSGATDPSFGVVRYASRGDVLSDTTGSHSHSVDAPVLAVDFIWVAILP